MSSCVFIDWDNIEKYAKKEGCVLVFEELYKTSKQIATRNDSIMVDVRAYGDFDKGTSGMMSSLINIGITPHHVVTKSHESFFKGSADIEMSLDILETAYRHNHISEYIFFSGDRDLSYVIRRLKLLGKKITVVSFEESLSSYLKELSDDTILLNEYVHIMRKVSLSEKQKIALKLINDRFTINIVREILSLEKKNFDFIGLNYLKKLLIDKYSERVAIEEAITQCLELGLLITNSVKNPNDVNNPTTSCILNREHSAIVEIMKKL